MLKINLKKKKGRIRRKPKYGAIEKTVDNIKFKSTKEANYYCYLKILKRSKKIKDFKLQPSFLLQEMFRKCEQCGKELEPAKRMKRNWSCPNCNCGKWETHKSVTYYADFRVINNDNTEEIIDTKGWKTPEYKIKKKWFLKKYPNVIFKEK